MKRLSFSIILGLLLCIGHSVQAQVTIGSSLPPNDGSLLDLKESNNAINATKGLGMPRVMLTSLTTLDDIDPLNLTRPNKDTHIGLMVYNTALWCSGLFVWDGTKWLPLAQNQICIDNPELLKQANAYIVPVGGTVHIPIIKAYAVWKQRKDLGNKTLAGTISVELVWQDNMSLIAIPPSLIGEGIKSEIEVKTAAGKTGNAVIAVRIDGQIRWSWHIWVTDYDPMLLNKPYNNGTKNTVFMDRNLGATLSGLPSSAADISVFGLLYQWGRSTPFPGSAAVTGVEAKILRPIYAYGDTEITTGADAKGINKANIQDGVATFVNNSNLQNAVLNPRTFYYNATSPYDWYASADANINDYLWSTAIKEKGVFDPCPAGWRVPLSGEGSASPWFLKTDAVFINYKSSVWNNGLNFADLSYPLGAYPISVGLNSVNGTLMPGLGGYYWTATPNASASYYFKIGSTTVIPSILDNRAYGMPVRCVKDN